MPCVGSDERRHKNVSLTIFVSKKWHMMSLKRKEIAVFQVSEVA